MAAAQTQKQQRDRDEHPIPRELFRRVSAARLSCAKFKVVKCRKFEKCTRSHDIDGCSDMNFNLPYTTRYMTEDGRDVITHRPPLTYIRRTVVLTGTQKAVRDWCESSVEFEVRQAHDHV